MAYNKPQNMKPMYRGLAIMLMIVRYMKEMGLLI